MSGRAVREDLRSAGFGVDMILANVTKLKALVESLEWDHPEEGWSEYHSRDHVARDRDAKAGFLGAALEQAHPGRVLDLGANDGHFTKLAAEAGAHVVAVDSDEAVFDRLYRESLGIDVSLVVTDLANPSPSQGWAGRERPGLTKRARPDLVIAYGLIHHLIYTASIPASGVISWLRRFSCPVVLEFVSPDDVMVGQLTANKLDHEIHPGGEEAHFRSLLEGHFEVVSERDLPGGTRVLFQLRPR